MTATATPEADLLDSLDDTDLPSEDELAEVGEQLPLCACGCGKPVLKASNDFVQGHSNFAPRTSGSGRDQKTAARTRWLRERSEKLKHAKPGTRCQWKTTYSGSELGRGSTLNTACGKPVTWERLYDDQPQLCDLHRSVTYDIAQPADLHNLVTTRCGKCGWHAEVATADAAEAFRNHQCKEIAA